MPGVLCGYIPTPDDAYLFAQINNGNAVSLPLGEEYPWHGTENLILTIKKLFSQPRFCSQYIAANITNNLVVIVALAFRKESLSGFDLETNAIFLNGTGRFLHACERLVRSQRGA